MTRGTSRNWRDATIPLIRSIQKAMSEEAAPCFLESDIEHLRATIRLTVEFNAFIEQFDATNRDSYDVGYAILSIFSGIDSFASTMHAYKALVGAEDSAPRWWASETEFKDTFTREFTEFLAETRFETKCRRLLDLFKMQIVFAGVMYED